MTVVETACTGTQSPSAQSAVHRGIDSRFNALPSASPVAESVSSTETNDNGQPYLKSFLFDIHL